MKPITISFSKGTQFPPKLGTLILKPTVEGKAAYAQNIDLSNDEYGNGVVVPGPVLTNIGNNSELTGVPTTKEIWNEASTPTGSLYFGQRLLGTKNVVKRIKSILSGSTPVIDTAFTNGSIDHLSHANQEIVDMVIRPVSQGDSTIYVALKDDTDCTLWSFSANNGNPIPILVATNGNFTGGYTDQFLVASSFDNNLYWIGQQRVSSIDTSNNLTVAKLSLGLPLNSYATCGVDWQQQLIIAYTTSSSGQFTQRLNGTRAGVAIWDYFSPGIIRNISAPCRYISALINAPDGQLLAFGGVDEGKSSIYSFNGYGFQLITQYIGDLPRSRHSVEFDGQGRILWNTADGQLCRYDRTTGIFEHLGSITTGSSAGGLLAKGIGSPTGNEFFVASGTGTTYTMKKVQFGSYAGDGDTTDMVNTPLVVSGIQTLPQGSNIQAITLHLAKSLETGEKVELRIYANGSTTPTTYFTMSYANDGAISSKREAITLDNINSFSLAVAWKQADGLTTAPPVLSAEVEPGSQF